MSNTEKTCITWHGHSNFQIAQGNLNILIDPFFTGNPACICKWEEISRPDLVLVTHLHDDHVGDAVNICRHFDSALAAPVGVAEKLRLAGVPAKQILNGIGFNIGGRMHFGGAALTMTEASHTGCEDGAVGYIITLPDGFNIFHAGDTGLLSNFQTWSALFTIDLALLPAGGVFTMDARQAALGAFFLKAKAVIPMHWGTFPGLAQSMESLPRHLAALPFAKPCECIVMAPGSCRIF